MFFLCSFGLPFSCFGPNGNRSTTKKKKKHNGINEKCMMFFLGRCVFALWSYWIPFYLIDFNEKKAGEKRSQKNRVYLPRYTIMNQMDFFLNISFCFISEKQSKEVKKNRFQE